MAVVAADSRSVEAQEPAAIEAIAQKLQREVRFVDEQGYEHTLLAGVASESGEIAYVNMRSKELANGYCDDAIRVHLLDKRGYDRCCDIESYNPFFGCSVQFFQWVGDRAILIYHEKHQTYLCHFGDTWGPRFMAIDHDWRIKDGWLTYKGYQEERIHRWTFPQLEEAPSISINEASSQGILPPGLDG